MQLNWGLATNQPNPLAALQAGYEQGKAMQQQAMAENALSRLQTDPNDVGAFNALAGAAPAVAQQVGQRMRMVRDAEAEQRTRQVRGAAFGAAYDGVTGGQRPPMASQMPATAPTAPPQPVMGNEPGQAPAAPDMAAQPGDDPMQTVEASRPDEAREAFMALAQEDPGEAMQLVKWVQSSSKEQREAALALQEPLAAAAYELMRLPESEWQAAFAQMTPQLMQRGVTPEMLQSVVLTRAGLQGLVTQTLGLKGAIQQANVERDDARADEQLGISRAQLGVAQGNLAVARGNLALRGAEAGRGPAPTPAARLPVGEVNKLVEDAKVVEEIRLLRDGFDPKFSGVGTGAENFAARLGLNIYDSSGESADWWQRMDAFDNVVRNQLFGASLTAGEQSAWEKTTVTPNMSPARIKANLAERDRILDRALRRRTRALEGAGYNVGGAAAAIRPQAPAAGRPAARPARGGRVIDFNDLP